MIEELNEQNWEEIIKACTLHAVYQIRYFGLWNRRGIKGYSAEEIAMEAIEKVYSGEWKWDPNKSSLIDYLKYHVIFGLVSNLRKSSEFKTTHEVDSSEHTNLSNADKELETVESIDQEMVIELIRERINSDKDVEIVFEELLIGMKRADICEKYDWENKVYDNANRRLIAIIAKLGENIKD